MSGWQPRAVILQPQQLGQAGQVRPMPLGGRQGEGREGWPRRPVCRRPSQPRATSLCVEQWIIQAMD